MKAALRARMRTVRRGLRAADPDAAARLDSVFAAAARPLPFVAAVYRAMGSEIDPEPLAAALAARGVRIVLPVVIAQDTALVFRERGRLLAPDALGLPAPPPQAAALRPDLVFVPLLAFDRSGARLGQGGGYYDRTLAALRAGGPPVRAIGLAYAGQEVARAPTDAFDQRLDGVLTESAYFDCT